jgi:TonB family protein
LSRKPAAASPAAVTKAPASRSKPSSAGQTSPTGPASLAAKTNTKNETMAQRIERIRRSARPLAAAPTDRRKPPAKKLDPKEIAARLGAGVEAGGRAGGKGTNPQGTGSGDADGPISVGRGRGNGSGDGDGEGDGDGDGGGGGQDPFLAAISEALREAWETPSRAEIGSGDRAVSVKITLRSDGRVTAFQVTRSSGNTALDQSVQMMLRQLRTLPAPAQYGSREAVRTIDIVFKAL